VLLVAWPAHSCARSWQAAEAVAEVERGLLTVLWFDVRVHAVLLSSLCDLDS
jgi:hypothetical protein